MRRTSTWPCTRYHVCRTETWREARFGGSCDAASAGTGWNRKHWGSRKISRPWPERRYESREAYWCSIWKLRWPVNQSLKGDCSTLHVEMSWNRFTREVNDVRHRWDRNHQRAAHIEIRRLYGLKHLRTELWNTALKQHWFCNIISTTYQSAAIAVWSFHTASAKSTVNDLYQKALVASGLQYLNSYWRSRFNATCITSWSTGAKSS